MTLYFDALIDYIQASAPYLLMGCLAAGFFHEFVSFEKLKKNLAKDNIANVFKMALLGIPLPLCSCAVIPTAVELRKAKVGKGPTSSFLIATPESGIDSVAMTYALMDLPMTILRPIAAFASAFIAGIAQVLFNPDEIEVESVPEAKKSSCCNKTKVDNSGSPFLLRVKKAIKYGVFELLEDMAIWLSVGIFLGAVIQVLVPETFFDGLCPTLGRLVVLAVGVPLYICASATTPIAASLVMKGMNPGVALILLLVGPATNVSNLLVLQKHMGKKAIIINVLSIVIVALIFSYIVDFFYAHYNLAVNFKLAAHEHAHSGFSLVNIAAIIFSALLLRALFIEIKKKFTSKATNSCH